MSNFVNWLNDGLASIGRLGMKELFLNQNRLFYHRARFENAISWSYTQGIYVLISEIIIKTTFNQMVHFPEIKRIIKYMYMTYIPSI